jgi:protoporphyrin/coproporphyrin ferrochelatase
MEKKTAVLLINLGTPDSASVSDVRKYLTEFLNDSRVIDIPFILRKILVNLIIVPFRAPKSAKIYKELWDLGNGVSPLLKHSKNVSVLLQDRINNATVFLAMRYGNPSLDNILEEIRKLNFDQIIILPLFPQYASASTGSAIEKAMTIIKGWYVIPDVKIINQFYQEELFIDSIIERAKKYNLKEYDHILFSYHGLPIRQVDKVYEDKRCSNHHCEDEINDENKYCYKATCYATTRLIASKLNLEPKDYTVCFQSRLDKKWLEPFSDKVVESLAKKGAKNILVFSPAFVADCLETIIEIGSEYQEIFHKNGGNKVQLVESLNDHQMFIDCLEKIVKERI